MRVSEEDVEHARRMMVWCRYSAVSHAWNNVPRNAHVLREWQRIRPKNDARAEHLMLAAQPEHVRECLSQRPKAPDQLPVSTPRPNDYLPPQ